MEHQILPCLTRSNANINYTPLPKVLQFGGGNFLRAFIDWMVQKLNEKTDFDGGVIVVKPTEHGDYLQLREQDGLFYVSSSGVESGVLISKFDLITCINHILNPYQEWSEFLASAEIPTIRFIVSNTTEAGIRFNDKDEFNSEAPAEFPAKLTRWLYHRFQFFNGTAESGCYILPCELIEGNGSLLSKCVEEYAIRWKLSDSFMEWITQHNFFCNTLVDRIVPGFPTDRREELFHEIGFRDELLVDAEPYHLWAIQGPTRLREELPLDQTDLNVVFTNDLQPYRQLKVRILNGLHTAMVPVGYLAGITTVREAIEDDFIGSYLTSLLQEEILPTLNFPRDELENYAQDILDRFRNPFIKHRLISISLNSTSKYKTRLLPSILAHDHLGLGLPKRIAFSLAALICFYRGEMNGTKIPLHDTPGVLEFFRQVWATYQKGEWSVLDLTISVLANKELWDQDLNKIEGFAELLSGFINCILENSIQSCLKDLHYRMPPDM